MGDSPPSSKAAATKSDIWPGYSKGMSDQSQHLYALTLTGLSPRDFSSSRIEETRPEAPVPAEDWWRLSLLKKLLVLRNGDRKTERLNARIDSLCNTATY